MASRPSSARSSGESGEDMAGVLASRTPRKRAANGEEVVFGDPERKRRKKEMKKPSFKPQTIGLTHSSDTPPENDEPIDLPPPPSERKIARKRESTRAIREQVDSHSSTREAKPAKRRKMDSDPDPGEPTEPMSQTTPAPFLDFSRSSRPRPSAPRPMSPPRSDCVDPIGRQAGGSNGPMGAPVGFVRKTRKSMRGLGLLDEMSQETIVALSESETPMIRKNKELREAQRRSSLGMRGQRASSSLGRGDISVPHSSVDSKLYYTHLAPSIPEPIRARHLIAWCAKRALDGDLASRSKSKGKERSRGDAKTEEGDRMVKEVMEEFIGKLGMGGIDTNVFDQSGSTSTGFSMRPHPRNVLNKETEVREQAIIKRCKQETNQWAVLVDQFNRRRVDASNQMSRKRHANLEPAMSSADGWMRDAMALADKVIMEGEGDLSAKGEFADVEYTVDTLLQSTHAAVQYSHQAQRFLDGIFSSVSTDLRNRETSGLPSSLPSTSESDVPDPVSLLHNTRVASTSKTAGKDPIHLLRALAQADAKGENQEVVAAAARVAPVQLV